MPASAAIWSRDALLLVERERAPARRCRRTSSCGAPTPGIVDRRRPRRAGTGPSSSRGCAPRPPGVEEARPGCGQRLAVVVDRVGDVLLVGGELVGDLLVEALDEGRNRASRGGYPRRAVDRRMPPAWSPAARGSSGSHLCEELLRRGHRVICVDNLETGSLANIEHIRSPDFVHLNVDIIEPYYVDEPIDFVYHLASPASPIDYLRLPLHTLKVGSHGTHHTLGAGQVQARAVPARLDQRGLRRPAGPPAARVLLGPRQPDRPARRLRRGQALRRGADDGLPPPAGRRHGDRAHLQHLRPAHAPARRPRDPDLPAPGARRTARSRCSATASQTRSFCFVTDLIRGIIALAESGYPPPGQHRQPERVHAARAGRDRRRGDRLAAPRSSSRRCPRTTRRCASPTSRSRASCSAGSPRSSLREGLQRTIDQAGVELLVGACTR